MAGSRASVQSLELSNNYYFQGFQGFSTMAYRKDFDRRLDPFPILPFPQDIYIYIHVCISEVKREIEFNGYIGGLIGIDMARFRSSVYIFGYYVGEDSR